MSEVVHVVLGERSYDIHVGPGTLARVGKLVREQGRGRVPVVTDENVAKPHLGALLEVLRRERIDARPIVLPAGEASKSFATLERLTGDILRAGVDRAGLVLALGGGVIGDLTGLAAGLVKRGVNYAQIPTTLLAQVDSSVGGKTAINTPEGKNLVGLFHQPNFVIADTNLLATLPRRELLSGYAEVMKYGALGDSTFFAWLEANAAAALAGNRDAVTHAVVQSCRIKAGIVSRDERESGERALLNLGHTFGHALEAATDYSDRLLHGEAVAIGIAMAFALSSKLGFCPDSDCERVTNHIKAMGLPACIADIPGERPDPTIIFDHMQHDKKARGTKLGFILVRRIGDAFESYEVDERIVRQMLAA